MNFRKLAKYYLFFIIIFLFVGSFHSLRIFSELHSDHLLQSPSQLFWMGTDSLGRDLWSRLIIGGIVSLSLSLISTLGALLLGVLLGSVMGFSDKYFDRWGLQLVNIYQSIPSFVIASVLCLSFQNTFRGFSPLTNSIGSLILCLIFTHWISSARLIRAEIKRMKSENFILASVSMGSSQFQILKTHLWLYLRQNLGLLFGFIFPSVLFYESFLSFVGFGIQAPLTSWGLLIQEGWRHLASYPHLMFIPIFFVVTTVWAVNAALEIEREEIE